MLSLAITLLLSLHGPARDAQGRIKRSPRAVAEFKQEHPCPIPEMAGHCIGFVVDHCVPLECGGADSPGNMQWQDINTAKEKDKIERYCHIKGCDLPSKEGQ
jgi:hypothetical protein